jgi:saccharopine dehydrogenase (NAD+, L-lysine forming)
LKSVLIIGAGAAGSVVAQTVATMTEVFKNVHLASRSIEKCEALKKKIPSLSISQLDADNTHEVVDCMNTQKPDMVINMALPYQDLSIMDACLETGVHYLDTANYEPKDKAEFCYKWQWDYHDAFKKRGLLAVLGCGFDPGVTNTYCAYAQKHLFDEISSIDIIDCNDGQHGHPFATNFNPEINIREITQHGKYYDNGNWVITEPLSVSKAIHFPEVGVRKAYLMYHEELESLAKHIPCVKKIRFWMTFSDQYLNYLNVLQSVGMTGIEPISYQGKDVVPLQFLKEVLPSPASLGENYKGKTSIGCIIEGKKEGKHKKIVVYNVCEHERCFKQLGCQAVSFTTGIPASLGAKLMAKKIWVGEGVFNVEELNPDPFLEELNNGGLPWKVKTL